MLYWCQRLVSCVLTFSCLIGCGSASSPGGSPEESDGVLAFVGARIVDGLGGSPIENGVLLVAEGRVKVVGPRADVEIPAGAVEIDVRGKTLIPGLVNAHGHVGASRGLSQSADNYTRENILDHLSLYARYGVTTVFSLGGDGPEGVQVRNEQGTAELDRARLFVAGPVVAADTAAEAREQVRAVAELGADIVKIRVDDFLGRGRKMAPEVYSAVIDEAHALSLEVAVHLYYLEDAKAVLRAGADFIVHSVRDTEVDSELVDLLKASDTCLSPTLTREVSTFVYEATPDFFADPFFLREADEAVLAELQRPERQARTRENPSTQVYKEALRTAQSNLRILSDAGVAIAFGTDSGPPTRFQGYFEHLELELMAEAGLDPMQILVAATSDAARCSGLPDVGALAPGRWADLVVLDANPLEDILNTRTIHSVWIAGNRVPDAAERSGAGP